MRLSRVATYARNRAPSGCLAAGADDGDGDGEEETDGAADSPPAFAATRSPSCPGSVVTNASMHANNRSRRTGTREGARCFGLTRRRLSLPAGLLHRLAV